MEKLINATCYLSNLSVRKYKSIESANYKKIISASHQIKGVRVVHISGSILKHDGSRYFIGGGGLSEILKTQIPLERSIGITSDLYLANLSRKFYSICFSLFDKILLKKTTLTENNLLYYDSQAQKLGKLILNEFKKHSPDIIVIHDFEYLPIIKIIPPNITTILHWHVDFPSPEKEIALFFEPYIKRFNQVITHSEKIATNLRSLNPNVLVIPPSINPLSDKNKPMTKKQSSQILNHLGINCNNPIIAQVGRFSKQKNPMKAIKIYLLVKKYFPNTQLILAGLFNIKDNKESLEIVKKIDKLSKSHPGIFAFYDVSQIGRYSNDDFINAIYTASDIILSLGTKEAFGLTTLEAMWKEKVVIAQKAPGPLILIQDSQNGFIIKSGSEAVEIITKLFKNKGLKNQIEKRAHNSIKNKYLTLRYLLDYLKIYNSSLK